MSGGPACPPGPKGRGGQPERARRAEPVSGERRGAAAESSRSAAARRGPGAKPTRTRRRPGRRAERSEGGGVAEGPAARRGERDACQPAGRCGPGPIGPHRLAGGTPTRSENRARGAARRMPAGFGAGSWRAAERAAFRGSVHSTSVRTFPSLTQGRSPKTERSESGDCHRCTGDQSRGCVVDGRSSEASGGRAGGASSAAMCSSRQRLATR